MPAEVTIACVLRGGGPYVAQHVQVLQHMVRKHTTVPHRFVCMSDELVNGVECIPLSMGWPSWWSKIELFDYFRGDGPVVALDLDTAIVSNIDDLLTPKPEFVVLTNFWQEQNPHGIGSAVMAWRVDLSHIFDVFRRNPNAVMSEYRKWPERFGDQSFIQHFTPVNPDYWQRLFPGRIVGYKHHCLKGVPAEASIVCYGGRPRPWETDLWLNEQREFASVDQQHN